MKVDRHVQFGDLGPQRGVGGVIKVAPGLIVPDVGVAVDQGSDRAEVTVRSSSAAASPASWVGRNANIDSRPGNLST